MAEQASRTGSSARGGSMAGERIKTIYAQARRPGTDRIAFIGAWREHGGIAMQRQDYFGKVVRYVQSDALATSGSLSGEARAYDGVGEIVFSSLEDLDEANASAGRNEIVVPHGRRIFGSPVPVSMTARESVEWFDHLASAKVYVLVKRHPSLSRGAFEEGWAEACTRWREDPAVRADVRSYARSVAIPPDSEFDGVEEITFDTLAAARRAHVAGEFLVRSLPICQGSVAILTRQVVLLDAQLFDRRATHPRSCDRGETG